METTEKIYSTLAENADFQELVEMYVADVPERIDAFQARLQNQDWESIRVLAHQMKGSARGYGFGVVSDWAAELEFAVKENGANVDSILPKFEQLINGLERVTDEVPVA